MGVVDGHLRVCRQIGGSVGEGGIDWDVLYADVAAYAGWTPSQIDDLTLPQVKAYLSRWRENHPVRRLETMLAIALRLRRADPASEAAAPASDDFADLVAEMSRGGMGGGGCP